MIDVDWWWPQMKLQSKVLQIGNVTCKMRDKGQGEKSRISCRCRNKERRQTNKNCPAEKSWPNHVKNEQHIGSKKTYDPHSLMMRERANENAAGLCRIRKRSDQPKIPGKTGLASNKVIAWYSGFSCCPLSRVLHVILANDISHLHLVDDRATNQLLHHLLICFTVLTRRKKVKTAIHGCNSWLSVWTLSCRCPVTT